MNGKSIQGTAPNKPKLCGDTMYKRSRSDHHLRHRISFAAIFLGLVLTIMATMTCNYVNRPIKGSHHLQYIGLYSSSNPHTIKKHASTQKLSLTASTLTHDSSRAMAGVSCTLYKEMETNDKIIGMARFFGGLSIVIGIFLFFSTGFDMFLEYDAFHTNIILIMSYTNCLAVLCTLLVFISKDACHDGDDEVGGCQIGAGVPMVLLAALFYGFAGYQMQAIAASETLKEEAAKEESAKEFRDDSSIISDGGDFEPIRSVIPDNMSLSTSNSDHIGEMSNLEHRGIKNSSYNDVVQLKEDFKKQS